MNAPQLAAGFFTKRSDKLPKRDMNIGLERMKQDMHKKGEPK